MDLPTEQKLRIPYFLLQSLIECGIKLKEETPEQLAHYGLINLLVEDALQTYTVPLSWEIFYNMSKDDDIWILAEELTSSSSEEKGHIEAERKTKGKEAKGKKTQGRPPQEKQEEKQEKGQAPKAKAVGGVKAQTPREKRLQTQVERTEKVQTSEGTPKETTTQVKEKAPLAKQAKSVKTSSTGSRQTVSIGSQKIASTGNQKMVTTRLSTGSLGKGQKKEKSPDILAREVVAFLATLSTSPKQKGKRKRDPSLYFKARRSMRIKTGRPQPPSKEPITIVDTPITQKDRSPCKAAITYEQGSSKTPTWRERMKMLDTKASLQDAETILQETLARLKETEAMEGEAAKSPQREEKVEHIMEPSPQPSLGSYYNFLEAGKIIPQKFPMPLFLALEEERVRIHTWMKLTKSKGVADIGPLEV